MPIKTNDKDDLNNVKMNVLDSILGCISSEIKVNQIGAYMKNSKCNDEYNIVKWVSFPYTIQEGCKKPGIKIINVAVSRTKLNSVVNTVGCFLLEIKNCQN